MKYCAKAKHDGELQEQMIGFMKQLEKELADNGMSVNSKYCDSHDDKTFSNNRKPDNYHLIPTRSNLPGNVVFLGDLKGKTKSGDFDKNDVNNAVLFGINWLKHVNPIRKVIFVYLLSPTEFLLLRITKEQFTEYPTMRFINEGIQTLAGLMCVSEDRKSVV